jgi:serpin B
MQLDSVVDARTQQLNAWEGYPSDAFRFTSGIFINRNEVPEGTALHPLYEKQLAALGGQVKTFRFSDPKEVQEHARLTSLFEPAVSVPIPHVPNLKMLLFSYLRIAENWNTSLLDAGTLPFHGPNGLIRDIPFLGRKLPLPYLNGGDFQVVQIPLQRSWLAVEMILPSEKQNIHTLIQKRLSGALYQTIANGLSQKDAIRPIALQIPEIEGIEFGNDLMAAYRHLGMQRVFGFGADFSGITGGGVFASAMDQRGRLYMTAKKVGASALTRVPIVYLGASAPPEGEPLPLTFDRPYLVVFRDLKTGEILFMARILDPTTK